MATRTRDARLSKGIVENQRDGVSDAIDIKEELIGSEDEEDLVEGEHEIEAEKVPAVSKLENATYCVFLIEEQPTYSKLTSLLVLNPSEDENRWSSDVRNSSKSGENEDSSVQSSSLDSVTQDFPPGSSVG